MSASELANSVQAVADAAVELARVAELVSSVGAAAVCSVGVAMAVVMTALWLRRTFCGR